MCLSDYRELAKILKTPPMFVDVIPLIASPDEVELMLKMSDKKISVHDLSKLLGSPPEKVESQVKGLFNRGFLNKVREKEARYSLKNFSRIVSRYLSEGRKDALGKYVTALANHRTEEHVERAKADPHPKAKVLPIPEALEPVSVVLPFETAMDILGGARTISVRDCECRVTYGNCDRPLRTCLAIDGFSDELVERGVAEEITIEEAKRVLKIANENGLVHQALYTHWLRGEVFDICSCCPCCCMYLRAYKEHGVRHHIAGSGLMAGINRDKCNGCGECIERCAFGARMIEDGKSRVSEDDCLGCGLCVTTCPTGASKLIAQTRQRLPTPTREHEHRKTPS